VIDSDDGVGLTDVDERNDSTVETQLTSSHLVTGDGDHWTT